LPIRADVIGKSVVVPRHSQVDVRVSELDGDDTVVISPAKAKSA
jgi:pyrimidine operon attenuation protein/uracil phosphoribosyltransferase